jgi:hypothetical protein
MGAWFPLVNVSGWDFPSWVSMERALKIPIGFIQPPLEILICHGQAFKVLGTSTL